MLIFGIMGIITALNNRIADGVLDFTIFCVICGLFSTAGQAGIFVGMVASFVVSIYLFARPPKIRRRIL